MDLILKSTLIYKIVLLKDEELVEMSFLNHYICIFFFTKDKIPLNKWLKKLLFYSN